MSNPIDVLNLTEDMQPCTRRTFLKGIALAGSAAVCPALLAGCGSDGAAPAETIAPTIDQKIAQMLLVGFRGTELSEDNYIVRDIRQHRIGGVILFDRDAYLKPMGATSLRRLNCRR